MDYRFSILIVILSSFLWSCGEESACLKSAGDEQFYELDLPAFSQVKLNDDLNLKLVQSEDTIITVTIRENLIDHLSFEVSEGMLIIEDHNTCNFLRAYESATVTIHHPNLSNIEHWGSGLVYSTDTLRYPYLRLFAKNAPGDFNLILNNTNTVISIDDLNNYYLSGKCEELFVGIYAGDGRIDAKELKVKKVKVFQRGSNDIMVYPLESLTGEIIGYGNVIYYNDPPVIAVEDNGQGELIRNP